MVKLTASFIATAIYLLFAIGGNFVCELGWDHFGYEYDKDLGIKAWLSGMIWLSVCTTLINARKNEEHQKRILKMIDDLEKKL